MKEQSVTVRSYPAVGRTCLSISFCISKVNGAAEAMREASSRDAMNVYNFLWKQIKLHCKGALHCRLKLVFGLMFASWYDFPTQPTISSVKELLINTILPAFGPGLTAMRIQMQYKQLREFSVQGIFFHFLIFSYLPKLLYLFISSFTQTYSQI